MYAGDRFDASAPQRPARGVSAIVYGVIDWFIPAQISTAGPDALRRSRLLVSSTFGMTLFALCFLPLVYATQGLSPTTWAFIVGCPLLLTNVFLLRLTRSPTLPGTLFALELITHLAFMAYHNGGYDSASLVWNAPIPILAAFVVGPGLGFVCAGILVAETFTFYLLDQAGYPFPQPLADDWMRWFQMVGSSTMLVFMALVGWLYDALHRRAEEALKQAQEALEQRVAERTTALQRAEEESRGFFMHAGVGMFACDAAGRFVKVNPAFCAYIGYSDAELLHGMTFWDITHPDFLDMTRQINAPTIAGSRHTTTYEKMYVRQDGTAVWGRVNGAWIFDDAGNPIQGVGMVEDITARKQAEDALRRERDLSASLLQAAPTFFVALDNAACVLMMNDAMLHTLGYTFEEVEGQDYISMFVPEAVSRGSAGAPRHKGSRWTVARTRSGFPDTSARTPCSRS